MRSYEDNTDITASQVHSALRETVLPYGYFCNFLGDFSTLLVTLGYPNEKVLYIVEVTFQNL